MAETRDAVIQTHALTHRYGDFTAIQDVDLTVWRGEIFGFLGPNGAGKTTTIRTLLDFIRPSDGAAEIFGLDTVQRSVEIHRRIGYMPSELAMWENWTGEDYIQWLAGVHGGDGGVLKEARRLAGLLEYDLTRKLKGMSTGMKRKMAAVAALAHKPELLILDEPTTGLDPLMQQVFHGIMRDVRSEGRTVFLSSHNLPEVEAICDRVGIIREGHLEAVETISNLTHVTFRWLKLTMAGPASLDSFSDIEGVSDLSVDGNTVMMRVSGHTDMDRLIKLAARHTVADIEIDHPTLEEIFLTYYGHKEA